MKEKCYSLFLNTASVKALTSFLVLILRTISANPASNYVRISGRPVIAKSMLGFFAPAVSNIFKKNEIPIIYNEASIKQGLVFSFMKGKCLQPVS